MSQLTAKTITVPAGSVGRQISVNRLPWRRATELLKKLSAHIGKFSDLVKKPADGQPATFDVEGVLPRLVDLITSVEELGDFLLEHATDLQAAEAEKLDLVDAGAVLSAACELNLGEDLKNSFAGIAASLSALVPAATKTPTPTSTSTSPKAA
ncbi:hypothetical protein [Actomonas aquatica]|uniref:Tail assembly chaperone n=1 Tax=Actomonas aquatica TaxID=2866162 RepID=A0ABZ1CCL3_9BACT|nr:hypothetical protein [Opitutus sp. WL0086]WRQ89413.1 hypothetical protein K1X11_008325 [Opitutus sp. WL0086]